MKKNLSFHSRKILLFFLSLGLLTVISWIIPLRPTYSEFEKRELTKFPSFSLQAAATSIKSTFGSPILSLFAIHSSPATAI